MGKLKLSSEMKEKFEAAVTGGGSSRKNSMKSNNEDEVGKLGEDRKKILEQKLRGAGSGGAGELQLKVHLTVSRLAPCTGFCTASSSRNLHRTRHDFQGN